MKYKVVFNGQTIEVPAGTRLRDALHQAGLSPHNGQSRWLNCKGFGTCGTCAVRIDGDVEPPSVQEKARLSFPPHQLSSGLRLACQVRVHADLGVRKFPGFWGQEVPTEADGSTAEK